MRRPRRAPSAARSARRRCAGAAPRLHRPPARHRAPWWPAFRLARWSRRPLDETGGTTDRGTRGEAQSNPFVASHQGDRAGTSGSPTATPLPAPADGTSLRDDRSRNPAARRRSTRSSQPTSGDRRELWIADRSGPGCGRRRDEPAGRSLADTRRGGAASARRIAAAAARRRSTRRPLPPSWTGAARISPSKLAAQRRGQVKQAHDGGR